MTAADQEVLVGGLSEVLEAHRIDLDKLAIWMTQNIAGFAGPLSYSKFNGGQSNPTYRLDTPAASYVLRRKPFGKLLPSAHAVDREFRLTQALYPTGFPVAKPLALCLDETVIGAQFYIMELVKGRTIWSGPMEDVPRSARAAHYHSLCDTLAHLHSIDHEAIGLQDFGKSENYFQRQVKRWIGQYRAAETERLESMERLIDWLPTTIPAQERTSIVHGDYRIDNVLFAPDGPEVLAVVDWELSTIGDPLADLTYFLMSWVIPPNGRAGIKGQTGEATGIPEMAEMLDRYCRITGLNSPPNFDWYFAFGLFRMAAILQGVKRRALDGNASNDQAIKSVQRLYGVADAAVAFAQAAGA